MVLFEEIIDVLYEGKYNLVFMLNESICFGTFREHIFLGREDRIYNRPIESELLIDDFNQFVKEHRESNYEMLAHTIEHPEFSEEKLMNMMFNLIYLFLEAVESMVECYIKGYHVPYYIYDLHVLNMDGEEEYYYEYLSEDEVFEPMTVIKQGEFYTTFNYE